MFSLIQTVLRLVLQAQSFSRLLGSANTIWKIVRTSPAVKYLILTLLVLLLVSAVVIWFLFSSYTTKVAEAAELETAAEQLQAEIESLEDSLAIQRKRLAELAAAKEEARRKEKMLVAELWRVKGELTGKDKECAERRVPPAAIRLLLGADKAENSRVPSSRDNSTEASPSTD